MNVPAPSVNVAAPNVSVNPAFTIEETEETATLVRDQQGRPSSLTKTVKHGIKDG